MWLWSNVVLRECERGATGSNHGTTYIQMVKESNSSWQQRHILGEKCRPTKSCGSIHPIIFSTRRKKLGYISLTKRSEVRAIERTKSCFIFTLPVLIKKLQRSRFPPICCEQTFQTLLDSFWIQFSIGVLVPSEIGRTEMEKELRGPLFTLHRSHTELKMKNV